MPAMPISLAQLRSARAHACKAREARQCSHLAAAGKVPAACSQTAGRPAQSDGEVPSLHAQRLRAVAHGHPIRVRVWPSGAGFAQKVTRRHDADRSTLRKYSDRLG